MANLDTVPFPSAYLDLLNSPIVGVLTTFGPKAPHAAPVWFCLDGDTVLVSTRSNRQKHKNLLRDPRVSFLILDPVNSMRYIEIRGYGECSDDPTYATRDRVVQKHGYLDGSGFDPPGTKRLTIRIRPQRIIEH